MTSNPVNFSLVFEKSPICLILVNSEDGTVHSANKAAHKLFECGDVGLIGRTTLDLGIWANPSDRSKLMHTLKTSGRLEKVQVSLKKLNGVLFDAEVSIEEVSLPSASLFLVAFYDVENLATLRFEATLFREHLAATLKEVINPSWYWSPVCGNINLSPQAAKLLSYSAKGDDYLSKSIDEFVFTNDLELIQSSFNGIDTDLDLEVRLLCGNNSYRWFRVIGSRLFSDEINAEPAILKGLLIDIHEKKLHLLELQKSSKRASLAASTADMGTWEVFPDGTSIWDPQTYRLYGYDPGTSKLPPAIFRDALSDGEYERASRWLGKSLKYGLSVSFEFQLRWPSGQMRWIAAKGGAIYDSDGKVVSLIGINWDITDRRNADEAVKRHQRELSSLTNQLLDQEKRTTKKLAQVLHDQLGQTLTAARLMLDFQQQTQPTDAGRRIEFLLTQAMQQVRDLLIELRPPLLDERGLTAALDNEVQRARQIGTQAELLYIVNPNCVDDRWPSDIEYAFFMIAREAIGNAIAHSHASVIEVHISCDQGGIVLEVVDNGIGFSPSETERFDGHLGLIGMKERATAIDARLSLTSQLGDGSRIKLMWIPSE